MTSIRAALTASTPRREEDAGPVASLPQMAEDVESQGAGFGIFPRDLRGKLTAYEVAVFVALTCRMHHETGQCWPSLNTLAEESGCSISSVRRALDGLRDKGEILITGRARNDGGQTSNIFTVVRYGGLSQGTPPLLHQNTPPALREQRTKAIELESVELENTCSPSAVAPVEPDTFEAWWDLYPRKVGKPRAQAAYKTSLKRKGVTPQLLLDALSEQLPTLVAADKKFQPHPTTWLNQGRWGDDFLTPDEVRAGSTSDRDRKAAELASFKESLKGMTLEDLRAQNRARHGL